MVISRIWFPYTNGLRISRECIRACLPAFTPWRLTWAAVASIALESLAGVKGVLAYAAVVYKLPVGQDTSLASAVEHPEKLQQAR